MRGVDGWDIQRVKSRYKIYIHTYKYIINNIHPGSRFASFVQKREQGRSLQREHRGSIEGAGGSIGVVQGRRNGRLKYGSVRIGKDSQL